MARRSDQQSSLLAQDLALDAYLDALLQTSTARTEDGEATVPDAVPSVGRSAAAALALVPPPVQEAETLRINTAAGVPGWARQDFQCLLFYVGPLKLAVPLVKLTRILPWGDHITATPGRPHWFLGLLARDHGQTAVLNTARLVFPRDRRSQAVVPECETEPRHIILVEDGRWGLTCDSLGDIISLSPDRVRWRTQRTTRRWLAGTVLDQMCALLDVEVLARLVAEDQAVPS